MVIQYLDVKGVDFCYTIYSKNNKKEKKVMRSIKRMDPELQTTEICLRSLQLGVPLYYVRNKLKTPELCMEAVKVNIQNINYVPEDVMTKEMVYYASELIITNERTFWNIPDKFKTEDFYIYAIEHVKLLSNITTALTMIPIKHRTYAVCLAAVKRYGRALSVVPKNLKSPIICEVALKNNGLALRYIINPSIEMCRIAVNQTPKAIKYVPKELLSSIKEEMEEVIL